MNSQPTGASTFAILTSQHTDQNCKRASTFATRRKNYFLKSLASKIFKTANAQSRQKNRQLK